MNVYPCPKGHGSSEADFCSECGAKINGSGLPTVPGQTSAVSKGPVCPDCAAPRSSADVVYCEVCGYNFATGTHGEIPLPAVATEPVAAELAAAEPPATEPVAAEPAPAEPATPVTWTVVVSIDPQLREAGSPEPPEDVGPYPITIDKPVSLIGRHSVSRAIDPEIPLDFDEAVSHRHAIVNRAPDGSLAMRDIGSSNGTMLNGAAVPPLVDTPLRDGDQITLGHWTKITVKAQ